MTKPTLQYAVLTVLLLWAGISQLTLSGFELYLQVNADRHTPLPFATGPYSGRITYLLPEYKNSGLKVGDEVMGLDGKEVAGQADLDQRRMHLKAGDHLMVKVKRMHGDKPEMMAVPVLVRGLSNRAFRWIMVVGLFVLQPLSCLAVGFFIAFARPRDPVAWITMGMLASFGQLVGGGPLWAIGSPWREALLVYNEILNDFWPFLMVLFALYFPVPLPMVQKRPWLGLVLSLPGFWLMGFSLYGDFHVGHSFHEIAWLGQMFKRISPYIRVLFTIYVSGFFALLSWQKSRLKAYDARRRLNVMIWGCSLSLLPLLYLQIAQSGIVPEPQLWLVAFCLLMLLLFPATMGYVIVVQRAMDVRMVVRSGVQYAVANTGIKVLRIAIFFGVAALSVRFIQESGHKWQAVLVGLVGAALVFATRSLAVRVSLWMDRRFFREAYNTEVILTDLSNSVADIRDTRSLLETVSNRISLSLHVPRVAVLLNGSGGFRPAYALGYGGESPAVELDDDTDTIRLLEDSNEPSRVYFDDAKSWVHQASAKEQSILQRLQAQLLLPVALKNRLLGVISLGPKLSDEPYSNADLRLLSAVASQTGLALENAQLTESVKQEVAQRERLNRELEIAREVQERLFPQDLPKIEGLDLAGYCRPALGVGGDYYDFIPLPDGALGIAIGDVSGKGIAAALTMASLQASLRGQTIRPGATLSEMIQRVNRLVYDASSSNRYATFFYCEYHPESRLLKYVNAGHNAPIVYRCKADTAGASKVIRLDKGGTVIGLFPSFPYEESHLTLEYGDVLIAFTDGISEAMNDADDEWEEEGLLEAIEHCHKRAALEMVASILTSVDAFTAGAPQHDDMTLVVVRIQ